MALKFIIKYFKMVFSVRPALRPWLFYVILYFFPVVIFAVLKKIEIAIFPSLKISSTMILAHQRCILGMVLFDLSTAIVAIILLIIKSSLNSSDIMQPIPKHYLFGALLPIVFPLFDYVLPAITGFQGFSILAILSISHDVKRIIIFMIWLISVGIIGPIQEEIIFRIILQGYFKEIYGGTKAIFLTTFAFSAVHIANVIFLDISIVYLVFITMMSLLLCAMREKTNNLSFCFAFHISNNILWIIFTTIYAAPKMPIELL